MFFGIELWPAKLGWDLFCSETCCKVVHGDERPDTFMNAKDFMDQTKRHLEKDAKCLNCKKPLN